MPKLQSPPCDGREAVEKLKGRDLSKEEYMLYVEITSPIRQTLLNHRKWRDRYAFNSIPGRVSSELTSPTNKTSHMPHFMNASPPNSPRAAPAPAPAPIPLALDDKFEFSKSTSSARPTRTHRGSIMVPGINAAQHPHPDQLARPARRPKPPPKPRTAREIAARHVVPASQNLKKKLLKKKRRVRTKTWIKRSKEIERQRKEFDQEMTYLEIELARQRDKRSGVKTARPRPPLPEEPRAATAPHAARHAHRGSAVSSFQAKSKKPVRPRPRGRPNSTAVNAVQDENTRLWMLRHSRAPQRKVSEQEREDCQTVFDMLDYKRCGEVQVADLDEALSGMGMEERASELRKWVMAQPDEYDGCIKFEEFLHGFWTANLWEAMFEKRLSDRRKKKKGGGGNGGGGGPRQNVSASVEASQTETDTRQPHPPLAGDGEEGAEALVAVLDGAPNEDEDLQQTKDNFNRMFMTLQTRNIEPASRPPGRKMMSELHTSSHGLGADGSFIRKKPIALPAFLWAPALRRLRRVERVLAGEEVEGVKNEEEDEDENHDAQADYHSNKMLDHALDHLSLSEMWHQTQLKVASARMGQDVFNV